MLHQPIKKKISAFSSKIHIANKQHKLACHECENMIMRQPRNLSFAVSKQSTIIFVLKLCVVYGVGTINYAKLQCICKKNRTIEISWSWLLVYFLFVSSWYSVSFNISWLRCVYWTCVLFLRNKTAIN